MELKEFASLIVGSANEAKNHISFLIGNLSFREESGQAILSLYEIFPDSYKDKSLFTPVMLKFFNTYKVNKENISYYNEFSAGWTANNIETVKKINPHWEWTKTEYKNSLEFSKAVYNSRDYKNSNKIFDFLNNNSDTFEKLIRKDKNKLITNFFKQGCWRELACYDYNKFSHFCEKYDFNKIDILKTEFIDSYSGIETLLFKYNTDELVTLFNDFEKNDLYNVFKNTHFLANRAKHNPDIKNRNGYTVLDAVWNSIPW